MWKEYGITNEGRKYSDLMGLTTIDPITKERGAFDDANLADLNNLTALERAYVDNYFGVRQLDPTKPQPAPENTPENTPEGTPDIIQETCTCTDPTT
jgi:hypothetical protein